MKDDVARALRGDMVKHDFDIGGSIVADGQWHACFINVAGEILQGIYMAVLDPLNIGNAEMILCSYGLANSKEMHTYTNIPNCL